MTKPGDTRAATADDVLAHMNGLPAQRHIRTLIEELDQDARSALRELESETRWIRCMQEQTAQHLDMLLQMRTTLDAIQSWIGGGAGC